MATKGLQQQVKTFSGHGHDSDADCDCDCDFGDGVFVGRMELDLYIEWKP